MRQTIPKGNLAINSDDLQQKVIDLPDSDMDSSEEEADEDEDDSSESSDPEEDDGEILDEEEIKEKEEAKRRRDERLRQIEDMKKQCKIFVQGEQEEPQAAEPE